MIKIFQNQNEQTLRYENLLYEPVPSDQGVEVQPRWGCTCVSTSENNFRIMGGIFDNENDFVHISSNICRVEIKDTGKYKTFTIIGQPKTNSNGEVVACLKPKINYAIKNFDDLNE